MDRTLVLKVTNNSATVTFVLYSYIYRSVNTLHTHGKMNLSVFLGSRWCDVFELDLL